MSKIIIIFYCFIINNKTFTHFCIVIFREIIKINEVPRKFYNFFENSNN